MTSGGLGSEPDFANDESIVEGRWKSHHWIHANAPYPRDDNHNEIGARLQNSDGSNQCRDRRTLFLPLCRARQLSNTCSGSRGSHQIRPKLAELGQFWADVGEVWPTCVKQSSTRIGRCWPTHRASAPAPSRRWRKVVVEIWPTSVEIGQVLAEDGLPYPTVCQSWPKSGPIRSMLAESRPNLASRSNCSTKLLGPPPTRGVAWQRLEVRSESRSNASSEIVSVPG